MSTNRSEGWLPPSIQSKVDHHIRWINRYLDVLPGGIKLHIEVARFDTARMKDPQIHGELYQRGRLYDYENIKAYVLAEFNYTCLVCGHKFDGSHKPRLHHITMRKNGATDNPDEFAPVCEQCHAPENHLPGGTLEKLRIACRRKEYREPTFMNILRRRLFEVFPTAAFTYGNITAADRKELSLSKSHANDAVTIALQGSCAATVSDQEDILYIRQVRKKKRSLHEATPRNRRLCKILGWQLYHTSWEKLQAGATEGTIIHRPLRELDYKNSIRRFISWLKPREFSPCY